MSDASATLRELLNSIAAEQKYYNYEVAISSILSGGANYTTQLYKAIISSPKKADLQLFVKVAALNENFEEYGLRELFKTEFTFYTDIAITYDTIQDKHNVRGNDRLIFPKFYGGNQKYLEETLVLEDLTARGFTTCQRFETIDWEFGAKAVEEMAKLHALSFAFAKEYPNEHQRMLESLKYMLPIDKKVFIELFDQMFLTSLGIAKDDHRERFRKFIEEQGGIEMNYRYSVPYRCPVLVHGDFKLSNLMQNIDPDGQLEITITDYQTMRAGSIPSDLIYFIFTSTDRQFRKQHMLRLVDHYYASLRTTMHLRGVHIDDVYPREDFDYEMKTILPYGILVAITALPILLVEDKDAPTVDKHFTLQDFAMKPNELFRERLNGIIDDFVEWGLL